MTIIIDMGTVIADTTNVITASLGWGMPLIIQLPTEIPIHFSLFPNHFNATRDSVIFQSKPTWIFQSLKAPWWNLKKAQTTSLVESRHMGAKFKTAGLEDSLVNREQKEDNTRHRQAGFTCDAVVPLVRFSLHPVPTPFNNYKAKQ